MADPADRFSTASARRTRSCCRCGCPPCSPWPRSRPLPADAPRAAAEDPPAGPARGLYTRRPGGVRAGGPGQREHGGRGQAVLAGPGPRRGHRHVLGRHRRHPPEHRRGPSQVASARTCPPTDLAALAATGGRPAGPPPLPPAEPGAAIEVDRTVARNGAVHLASRYVLAAEILGRPPGLHPHRGDHPDVLRPRDPRTAADPAQPADLGPGPPPARSPPRRAAAPALDRTGHRPAAGQQHRRHHGRRAENRPRPHPRPPVVTVHVAADTITIDLDGEDTRTVRRTTTQPVRSIKAHQPRKAAHVS